MGGGPNPGNSYSQGSYPSGDNPQFQEFFNSGGPGMGGFTFRSSSFGSGGNQGFGQGGMGGGLDDILSQMMGQFFPGSPSSSSSSKRGGRQSQFGGNTQFDNAQYGQQYAKQQQKAQSGRKTNTKTEQSTPKQPPKPSIVTVDITLEELYNSKTKNYKLSDTITTKSSTKPKKNIQKTFQLELNPSYRTGKQIHFDASSDYPKEVTFKLQVVPHKSFELQGNDLIYKISLTKSQLQEGEIITIPLLEPKKTLSINTKDYRELKNNSKLKMIGKGMPMDNTRTSFGDLYISFTITK